MIGTKNNETTQCVDELLLALSPMRYVQNYFADYHFADYHAADDCHCYVNDDEYCAVDGAVDFVVSYYNKNCEDRTASFRYCQYDALLLLRTVSFYSFESDFKKKNELQAL